MKLYVKQEHAGPHEGDGVCETVVHAREASPAEILAAARPLAHLEAAAKQWKPHRILSNGKFDWGSQKEKDHMRAIVDAALGADDDQPDDKIRQIAETPLKPGPQAGGFRPGPDVDALGADDEN